MFYIYINECGNGAVPVFKIGYSSNLEKRYSNHNYKFVGICNSKDEALAFEAKAQDIQALMYLNAQRFDSRSYRTIKEISIRYRNQLSHKAANEMIDFKCNSAKSDAKFRSKFRSDLNALQVALEAKYGDISKKYKLNEFTKASSYEEMYDRLKIIIKDMGVKEYQGHQGRQSVSKKFTRIDSLMKLAISHNPEGLMRQLEYISLTSAEPETSKLIRCFCDGLRDDRNYYPEEGEYKKKWSAFLRRSVFPGPVRAGQYKKTKNSSVDGLLLNKKLVVNDTNRKKVLDEWLAIERIGNKNGKAKVLTNDKSQGENEPSFPLVEKKDSSIKEKKSVFKELIDLGVPPEAAVEGLIERTLKEKQWQL